MDRFEKGLIEQYIAKIREAVTTEGKKPGKKERQVLKACKYIEGVCNGEDFKQW